MRAFCELTVFWSRIECPRGCTVELQMMLPYKMRELMDATSGYWVVVNTEKTVKMETFVLMDAYDNYRLSVLSPDVIVSLRTLNL